MADPLIKWAKQNTHSDPPLFPLGLKRWTPPLLSLLPPTRKGGGEGRGGGFLRNPIPWGVLKPPPFF